MILASYQKIQKQKDLLFGLKGSSMEQKKFSSRRFI